MKTVRAKFSCSSITKNSYGGTVARMHAVYGSDSNHENRAFNDATPSGTFEIQIAEGKPAAELFQVSREYYLDITLVPLPENVPAE